MDPQTTSMAATATQEYLNTIPADIMQRSIAFTHSGYWILLFDLVFVLLALWLIARSKILTRLKSKLESNRPRPIVSGFVLGVVFLLFESLILLPWTLVSVYYRKVHFNLSDQPLMDWLGQWAIELVITSIIGAILLTIIYLLLRWMKRWWWIAASVATGLLLLLMIFVSPVFLEPIFNKYEEFPEGEVKTAIEALAQESGIPDAKIFVFDGSRQYKVVTANVTGLFGTARIAVSDIAVERATLPEVRAVVSHEIGHYVLGHMLRTVVFFTLLIVLCFWLTDRWFSRFARWMGVDSSTELSNPAGLPVLMAIVTVILFLCTPITNTYIRLGENEADSYSLNHAHEPDGLASSLIKTVEYRKASPNALEEFLLHDHPSVENRVHRAMVWKYGHPEFTR